jgi:hypothetical protein
MRQVSDALDSTGKTAQASGAESIHALAPTLPEQSGVLKAKVAQEMTIDTRHDTKTVEIPYCGNRELLLPQCVAANFFAHRHAQGEACDQQNQPTAELLYARPALDPFHGSTHGPDRGRKCRQQPQELDPGSVQSFRHEKLCLFQ